MLDFLVELLVHLFGAIAESALKGDAPTREAGGNDTGDETPEESEPIYLYYNND